MNKQNRIGILVFIFFILALCAYGYYEIVLKQEINGSTLIDNPTSKDISVKIDEDVYQITAKNYLKVSLEPGIHTISCEEMGINNQKINLEPTEFGVINPTKSKYMIYNIIYTQKDLREQFKPYNVEGREIYSLLDAPIVTTDLFIPDRTLGKGNLDDQDPGFDTYNKFNQDYSYLTKIFRLNDFFEFYDKNNQ